MFGGGLERTQALGPEHFEGRPELSDGLRSRPIQALGPVPSFGDEARVLEDAEVLRDRRPRDVETARDVADGELLARDEAKDLAASRFTECGKWVDFSSVSLFLPSVKALGRPHRHRFTTQSRPIGVFTRHSAGESLCSLRDA
jgi:hypothetical protein